MTEDIPTPDSLPADLEERVYGLYFATAAEGRGPAIEDLAKQNPEHADGIHALRDKLEVGAGLFQPLESVEPEAPPERIGPYKILDKLSEEGMGVVYRAEQTEPIRRRVALKIIKPGFPRYPMRFYALDTALSL